MTPETLQKISKAVNRLIAETGSESHQAVVTELRRALRSPIFLALVLPLAGKLLPGAERQEAFEGYLHQIDTEMKFHTLLISLEEPNPEELESCLRWLKSATPLLRRILQGAKNSLRPSGGPPEKFKSISKIRDTVDAINRRANDGEGLMTLFPEFARLNKVSARTMRRRYEEEMRRRRSLTKSSGQDKPTRPGA